MEADGWTYHENTGCLRWDLWETKIKSNILLAQTKNFKLLKCKKNDWLSCLFFPVVKSNEWQMNCLSLMISHEWNHAEPDHVLCAQRLEVTYALKKLNTNRSCSWLHVNSAISLCLIFHWLDLLMDFYCRNRCWIKKEIFDCLDWNVTDAKKLALAQFFLYFLYIWIYCNDTQLMQIARNQNLG